MKTSSFQKRNGYFVLGGIGLFFSAGYLGMSFRLPFGQLDQPGAGVFPVIVGIMLMLASLTTMWERWRLDRAEQVEIPVSVARKRLLSLISLLFGYCLALPWLGQIISSILFCVLLVRMLSDLEWPRIVAYSLGISIALYVVFVSLLKVPLPRGVLAF
jgi:putative tricarboxylic transport membrane protein